MEHHLKYGLEGTSGRLVDVDSVANGLQCGCVCPYCKQRLVAKNGGTKREHHFAHHSESECDGARMTALHMLAQQIIQEKKAIMLPDYNGQFFQKQTSRIQFNKIALEASAENLRPDCIGTKIGNDQKEHSLWIEILVTHQVDETKQKEIQSRNVSCIEIDLSDMLNTDYSVESIAHRLLNEKGDRKWINCPKYDELNRQKEIEYAKRETERVREEEEKRKKREAEILHRKQIRAEKQKQLNDCATKWQGSGDENLAKKLIAEINREPYYHEKNYDFEGEDFYYDDYDPSRRRNELFETLVPQGDFLSYIDRTVKNESSLQLFYTLLHYYYDQTVSTNFDSLKLRLKRFQYSRATLTTEERIHLEQLVSLRVIYLMEKDRQRFLYFNDTYKKAIKSYITNPSLRNDILRVSSVMFHHIIGSTAHTFGELTQEIIQQRPHLASSYLSIVNSQTEFSNNYRYDGKDMLDELRVFVAGSKIPSNETINGILRVCYSFAFQREERHAEEVHQKTLDMAQIPVAAAQSRVEPKEDLKHAKEWKDLNEWYRGYGQ